MSRKGKQLLQEVLGEEKFQAYENGDWIGTKSPDGYEYFAKKGRFHVPIKRVPIEEEDDKTPKENEKEVEHPLLNDRFFFYTTPQTIWSRDIRREQTGKLNGNDLYDAVATYIQSAKLGKVNWMCGNIDINLPNDMPPENIEFLTFVKRGLKRINIFVRRFPRIYERFITESGFIVIVFFMVLSLPITLLLAFIDTFILNGIISPIHVGLTLSCVIPLLAIHAGYLQWKNKWEVSLE